MKLLKILNECLKPVDNTVYINTPSDTAEYAFTSEMKNKAETLLILYRDIFPDYHWELSFGNVLKANGELISAAFHDWSTAEKRKWLRKNVDNIVYTSDVLQKAQPYRQQRDHIAPTDPPTTYTTLRVESGDIIIANSGTVYHHTPKVACIKSFVNLQYHLRCFYTYRDGSLKKREYRDITTEEAINKYGR